MNGSLVVKDSIHRTYKSVKKSKKAIDLNGFQFSLSSTGCIMRSHELETHITFCFNETKDIWDIHITDENKHKRSKSRKIAPIASYTSDELFSIISELLEDIFDLYTSAEKKGISEISSMKGKYHSYAFIKENIRLEDEHYYVEVSGHKRFEKETIFPIFPNISQYFFEENNFQKGCISELIELHKLPSVILLKKDCGTQIIGIHDSVFNSILSSKNKVNTSEYFIISFEDLIGLKESFIRFINKLMNIKGDIIESISEHFPIQSFFDWVLEQIDLLPIKVNSDGIEIEFN